MTRELTVCFDLARKILPSGPRAGKGQMSEVVPAGTSKRAESGGQRYRMGQFFGSAEAAPTTLRTVRKPM
jgi:hypothetical protein